MDGEPIQNQTPLSVMADMAMELVDRLTQEWGEDFQLGQVIIVAEVTHDGDTVVETLSSERRPYVAAGILAEARRTTVYGPQLPDIDIEFE